MFLALEIRRAVHQLAHAKRLRQSAERILADALASREAAPRDDPGSRGPQLARPFVHRLRKGAAMD